jgi:hopanoid biosynthesis associated protein HpnK
VGRLIVNADDFGLTAGVNRAIVELHQAGVLTSTSLMARAKTTAEAIEIARATPTLGVGCHIVLVDGQPVLSPSEIPTLVDQSTGHLHFTLGAFLRRLFTGRIDPAEIEAEVAAQISYLQSNGVALTHIDTHKHTHMFPTVLRAVLRAARAAGIRAVRRPFEPTWSLHATQGASWLRRTQVNLLRRLEPAFQRIVAEQGFVTTDGVLGMLATGTLDSNAISAILTRIPAETWELVTHPGYNDAELAAVHTRLLASRDVEREALLTLHEFPKMDLISFADLAGG